MRIAFTAGAAALLVAVGCGDDDDDAFTEDVTGTAAPTSQPSDVFGVLDANGDSYLDADEIAEWEDVEGIFHTWDADADSELDRDEITGNAFDRWDADSNGRIDQQEWSASTELWYPSDTRPTVMNDWDNDGDSELDLDEFHESFDTSAAGESWLTSPTDLERFKSRYFDLYDVDDDGKVTRAEWVDGSRTFGIQ